MSNPTLEPRVKELLELKRMREEIDSEISAIEDELKKALPEIVERFMKQTTTRRFCIR